MQLLNEDFKRISKGFTSKVKHEFPFIISSELGVFV